MNKLLGAFLALGVVAVACGNDGNGNSSSPGVAGAAGEGTGATEADGGTSSVTTGGSAGSAGNAPLGGEGGTPATATDGGSGGDQQGISFGGAFEEVHGDPPIDPDCGDYSEHKDRSNDYSYSSAEATGLSLNKDTITICGRLDAYRFNQSGGDYGLGSIDQDYFSLDVLADGDYFTSLELLDDEIPELVLLRADTGFVGSDAGFAVGKRAGAWPKLYTGKVTVSVSAYANTPLTHSVPYKIRLRKDNPVSRCTTVKPADAKQSFTEAHDGAGNNGNDVLHYVFNQQQMPTAATTDAPEPSAIVLDIGDHSLIQGNSALVDYGDDYDDADMYQFKTGTSEVLTLRLDWAGAKTDLDLMLFEANDLTFQPLDWAIEYDLSSPEVLIASVKPNTNYWLYVAGGSDSAAGGLPAAYSVTLCGEQFKF